MGDIEVVDTINKKPMKILMMQQNACCIRNYKFAKVLKDLGHEVGLFTNGATPEDIYSKGVLKNEDAYTRVHKVKSGTEFKSLMEIIKEYEYQVLHAHNEPDYYAALGISNIYNLPIIHNCHDIVSETWRGILISERELNELMLFEALTIKNSDATIFVNKKIMESAKEKYGEIKGEGYVFSNYPLKSFIPTDAELKPKLSEKDGFIHIVYEGGFTIQANINGLVPERYYLPLFLDILENSSNIKLHIYTPTFDENIDSYLLPYKKNGLIYEGSIDSSNLITTISQYDYGIFGLANKRNLLKNYLYSLPNKMFEYFAAGLPLLADYRLYSINKFSEKYPNYVKVYKSVDDIYKIINSAKKLHEIDRFKFVFDDYASEIEALHRSLIEKAKKGATNERTDR